MGTRTVKKLTTKGTQWVAGAQLCRDGHRRLTHGQNFAVVEDDKGRYPGNDPIDAINVLLGVQHILQQGLQSLYQDLPTPASHTDDLAILRAWSPARRRPQCDPILVRQRPRFQYDKKKKSCFFDSSVASITIRWLGKVKPPERTAEIEPNSNRALKTSETVTFTALQCPPLSPHPWLPTSPQLFLLRGPVARGPVGLNLYEAEMFLPISFRIWDGFATQILALRCWEQEERFGFLFG